MQGCPDSFLEIISVGDGLSKFGQCPEGVNELVPVVGHLCVFKLGQSYVIGQPEHVEKLDRILFHFREYDLGAGDRGGIDHTEQYRHPDTVYNVRLREINDKLFAAFVQAEPALSLDLLARYFVEIIARKHNSAFIINRRGNIRFSLTDHVYFFPCYCLLRKAEETT